MPKLELSAGTIHYSELGRGVPLVLLHANPGDSLDFEAVIPRLAQEYRVIAIDWPGYGASTLRTSPASASAMLFADALRELVTSLSLPPALLIGNSVGAYAAVRLAIEAPAAVRGLVLVAPGGFTPHNFATRAFCGLQGGRFALSPRRFAGLNLRRRTPTVRAMLERAKTTQAEPERLALNRAVWRSFLDPQHDLREPARRLVAKTLLIFGKHDFAIPARRDGKVAAASIPGARLVVMPTGHAPFAEAPEAFLGEVLPFLASCVSPQPEEARPR